MEDRLIAALLMLPIVAVVVYAGVLEYRRYSAQGRATYGLAYDEKTGTTYVTEIPEDGDAFDPGDFDPGGHGGPKDGRASGDDPG